MPKFKTTEVLSRDVRLKPSILTGLYEAGWEYCYNFVEDGYTHHVFIRPIKHRMIDRIVDFFLEMLHGAH